jgi:electron transport complex protein RnfA
MGEIITMVISALFVSNIILSSFLGICPFLGISKKPGNAIGMGFALIFVVTMSAIICYGIERLILQPLGLDYLQLIVFILVIASFVQLVEFFMKKYMKGLYKALGIYLPLITTNCAVLGVAELVIDSAQMMSILGITSMNMGYAVLYGLFAGLGFTLAIVIMSGMREKITRLPINKHLKGFPIAMIAACFIAMAFYVFGLVG